MLWREGFCNYNSNTENYQCLNVSHLIIVSWLWNFKLLYLFEDITLHFWCCTNAWIKMLRVCNSQNESTDHCIVKILNWLGMRHCWWYIFLPLLFFCCVNKICGACNLFMLSMIGICDVFVGFWICMYILYHTF